MKRTYTLLPLLALALCCCKPTERTALKKKHLEQQQTLASTPPAPEPAPEPPPVAVEQPTPEPEPAPAPAPAPLPMPEPANSLLVVNATLQNYNPMRPWEKEEPRQSRALGVYIGEGRVLTVGRIVSSATYVELSLPDGSRIVPARILRQDEDMNLALLTVAHEEDASLFDTRSALPVGDALNRGDKASFAALINGVEPVHVDLLAENAGGDKLPLMIMRAARPLPEGQTTGAPVVREGKLSALGVAYKKQDHLMQAVNAEIIQRFLQQNSSGVPVLGLQFASLNDPIFRKYLKLDSSANGFYISKVLPGSAAEKAGIREGDVLTAIDELPLDNQGRCNHPRYGLQHAAVLLRGMKDMGQDVCLSISRSGEIMQLAVNLNRDAVDNALFRPQTPGVQPRYIMWGGMLFQPLTSTLLSEIRNRNNGLLPLELNMLEQNQDTLRAEGYKEPVALTFVLPTIATQGYDELRFSHLKAVNGKPVNSFAELPNLLDAATESGLIRLDFNKPPYTVYVDRSAVDAVNTHLQQQSIPRLRVVE